MKLSLASKLTNIQRICYFSTTLIMILIAMHSCLFKFFIDILPSIITIFMTLASIFLSYSYSYSYQTSQSSYRESSLFCYSFSILMSINSQAPLVRIPIYRTAKCLYFHNHNSQLFKKPIYSINLVEQLAISLLPTLTQQIQ